MTDNSNLKIEKENIEKTIRDCIEWPFPEKNIDRLYSSIAAERSFFIFHPDSKSTVTNFEDFDKTLTTIRMYFENNSVISGILEANVPDDRMVSGFFQVERVSKSGFLRLRDIHFRQTYLNVKINISEPTRLENTILYASIKHTAYGWRILNLDYIFPLKAKPYLH